MTDRYPGCGRVQDDELERLRAFSRSDQWLTDLLDSLPSEQAAAVRARVLDERGYPEFAAELGTSELVIRKRVSRGLASLRSELGKAAPMTVLPTVRRQWSARRYRRPTPGSSARATR